MQHVRLQVLHPKCHPRQGVVRMSAFRGLTVTPWREAAGATATLVFHTDPRGFIPESLMKSRLMGPAHALISLGAVVGNL